jgi:hypothetical protein
MHRYKNHARKKLNKHQKLTMIAGGMHKSREIMEMYA